MSHLCLQCTPTSLFANDSAFRTEQRTGEMHVGVRFGDVAVWTVTLDGDDVSNSCFEAIAGEQGTVLLLDRDEQGKPQRCSSCYQEIAVVVKTGLVSVARR